MRKPWRRKKNLIFSAVSGADATEHFSVFVIEGNEIIYENDECGLHIAGNCLNECGDDLVPTEGWGDRSQNCLHDVRVIGDT